ncbi:MAG: polysaccharide deacetylase family protein [Candidatus Saccharimonadia bacterium]
MPKKKYKKYKPLPPWQRTIHWLSFTTIAIVGIVGLSLQIGHTVIPPSIPNNLVNASRSDIRSDYQQVIPKLAEFQSQEEDTGINVVSSNIILQDEAEVNLANSIGDISAARRALGILENNLSDWQSSLSSQTKAKDLANQAAAAQLLAALNARNPSQVGLNVPILIYHYTPTDFENQLKYLVAHNYQTITFAQLVAALNHTASLPPKPVIITYDDGYENQMTAFSLLEKYNMKATFYIITGGAGSNYCIGANRSNSTCGDASLNWDQIRMLDQSGLITIGAHTVDHPNLAGLSAASQQFQIDTSKAEIEAQIGHTITDFAYPYGSYNATTISLVHAAGFTTAVTTAPGTFDSLSNLLTLPRLRNVYALP